MRKETGLNVPNVHDYTLDARRRTNGSGRLQAITHIAEPLAEQPDSLHRLSPKRWFLFMAENVTLPRWLVIAVMPSIMALLVGLGAFMWSVSTTLARMDERQAVTDYKLNQAERQNKLNDEHLRQTQIDFATLSGWQRGQAGEAKPQMHSQEMNEPQ